jgi:hypothetical protein
MMNMDELEDLLNEIFNSPDPESISLCNRILYSAESYCVVADTIRNSVMYLPDITQYDHVSKEDGEILNKGIAGLKRLYTRSAKQAEDIVFLLNWYQNKVRIKNGQAGEKEAED